MVNSIVEAVSDHPSTCGYCSPPGRRSEENSSIHEANLVAVRLSADVYQRMIDRGWRRSGQYCYKPDMKRTCCPQYTIKLDATAFKSSRSHRKLIHRWNRYVLYGQGDADAMDIQVKRPKGKDNAPFDLVKEIHAVEHFWLEDKPAKHKFEVTLEPSTFTAEKLALYRKYQSTIHQEKDTKSADGFKRFLVETPLEAEPIPYSSQEVPSHLPVNYGSYHQMYRVDGRLIAIAVLDILPKCVSSVYFMYDCDWEQYSLGKLSALREVSLAYEMHKAGAPVSNLYMGYYVHSCPKMRYKGEYSPSYLVDPETYEWYPLEKCTPLLEKNRYACFSNPAHSIAADASIPPPRADPLEEVDMSQLDEVYVVRAQKGQLVAYPLPGALDGMGKGDKGYLSQCILGVGVEVAKDIFWYS